MKILFALVAILFAPLALADKADGLFKPGALHTIHLKLTNEAFTEMQPGRRGGLSGWFAPATQPDDVRESPFGYQYTYVHAVFDDGKNQLADVGIRYKGNSSYMTGKGLKKPFKLDFNRYVENQKYLGLSSLNLHNNAMDVSHIRESMAFQIFRECGVPAARTSFALVYLTVDGVHNRQVIGLYSLVEEIDKQFLKRHFGTSKGLLVKPENAWDIPYLGEEFKRYEKSYRPKTDGDDKTKQRLIDFAKLIHKADDATFAKSIEQFLDVDAFLRFIAANGMLANMDSFLSTSHNYYMYVHPETLKIYFMPWDANLAFGTFDWVGSRDEQMNLSIDKPYVSPGKLLTRLFAIDAYKQMHRAHLNRFITHIFNPQVMDKKIAEMEAAVKQAEKLTGLPADPHKGTTRPAVFMGWVPPTVELRHFVEVRTKSIRDQLNGVAKGYEPEWVRGPFGGGGNRRKAATQPVTKPVARNGR